MGSVACQGRFSSTRSAFLSQSGNPHPA